MVKSKKGKGLIISIIIVIAIVIGVIAYFIFVSYKANVLYDKMLKDELDVNNLESEKLFDFKNNKYFGMSNISEGLIHRDYNGEISVISNIKIMGLYCSYNNNKMGCNIFNKKDTNISDMNTYDVYKIGEQVILSDDSKWHVIHDSSEYSRYITLIKDERIDVNNDGCTLTTGIKESDPDLYPFDKDGNKKYDPTSKSNIGYYLENDYKLDLSKNDEVVSIRLPYVDELSQVEQNIGFIELDDDEIQTMMETEDKLLESIGWMENSPRPIERLKDIIISTEDYKKLMPHWLFNDLSGNYWINPVKGKLYTMVWNGNGIVSANPKTGYGIKPVITIDKTKL